MKKSRITIYDFMSIDLHKILEEKGFLHQNVRILYDENKITITKEKQQ